MGKRITMNINQADKWFKEAVRAFIKHCRLKNLTERTMDYYEELLNEFIGFFGGDDFPLSQITNDIVENYTLHLKSLGIKSVTVNTRLRGVRVFLYWCMERGYLEAFKIKTIKQEEVIKSTYTDEEIITLLKKPNIKTCSFTDYRDWVIVNFLLATGVRASTLTSITIEDVDLRNSVFKTRHNKNRREQIIPISKVLNKVLTEYMEHRGGENSDRLFCSQYGQPLNANSLGQAIRRYGKSRGVMECGVHKFRHTFSKNWVLSGGDVFRLQKILGHSSMDIVRKYVNIYGTDLQKDFEKYNVLERLTESKELVRMNR